MNNLERNKWDAYYRSIGSDEPDQLRAFSRELAEWMDSTLPSERRRCLEAGCGAGFQSAALAELGSFETHLLDFSEQALQCARTVFAQRRLRGEFHLGDIHDCDIGDARFDLVFNVGALEHYDFESQVRFLRAMAMRSNGYVLAVVPNSRCYWYWISRIHNSAHGRWPFGLEVPATSFTQLFEAAGLRILEERYLGTLLTTSFLKNLPGIDDTLRDLLNTIHDQRLIPDNQSAYLYAALGATDSNCRRFSSSQFEADANRALAADAVASLVAMRAHQQFLETQVTELASENKDLRQSAALQSQVDSLTIQLHEKGRALETQSAELVQTTEQLRLECALREFATSGLQTRLDRATSRLQSTERELRAQAESNSNLRLGIDRLTSEAAAATSTLQRLVEELAAYRTALNQALRTYSKQRAWRLMVTVRKAYSSWSKCGWTGKFAAVRSLLFTPFATEGTYPDQEIQLPRPESFITLPQAAMESQASIVLPPQPTDPANHHRPLPRKYDVLVLAIIDFDFRYQRPQQVAAHFASNGHRVFWVSPTRFLSSDSLGQYKTEKLRENIWEVHLRGPQPDIYLGEFEADVSKSFRESLYNLFSEWAVSECIVFIQLPFWRRLALSLDDLHSRVLAYDCMDDWDSFQNLGDFNRQQEQLLAGEVDRLFVSAAKLKHKFESRSLRPILVRNGVDYDFFVHDHRPRALQDVPGPIIGYFGAIADWIDLDLIRRVAEIRPQYSFVMIGQVFGRNITKLLSLPNVYFIGHQPYDAIPSFLKSFDVCHIPFLLNDVTAATDPVKLYEYLSLGKPVVSTSMSELLYLGDLVLLANEPEEYAKAIDSALVLRTPEEIRRRQDFAQRNTWRARVACMDQSIVEAFDRITVVIVTHNCERFIDHCLTSIRRNSSYPNIEVVVVDNASEDGTSKIVEGHAREWTKLSLVSLAENKGFAAANNIAAQKASGNYLILLNPDTIVTPGWCGRLLGCLRREEAVGLVSAVTNFAGNEVKVSFEYESLVTMEEFAANLARQRRHETMEVSVAPLFGSIISKQLYCELGGLDERYEIGMFEDDDFAMALRKRGLKIVTAEDCFIHHFGQGAFSQLSAGSYEEIFSRNRARFESKWDKKWQPHNVRPGAKSPLEDRRFSPETFGGPVLDY